MSKLVCFYNNGTFDTRSFTIMGLSAKESDKAIGFFGTGFKYAIATLLRHGASVRLAVNADPQLRDDGYTLYTFTTKADHFRGKEHEFVHCVVEDPIAEYEPRFIELPFTTHLGANWSLWQAYRELYTNSAIDEGGGVMVTSDMVIKPADICIYVDHPDFMQVYNNHDKYFIRDVPTLCESSDMRCVARVENSDNVVYYRSMYTGTRLDKETYFTYDYTSHQKLTEDRTLADTWSIRNDISEIWVHHMDYRMLVDNLPHIAKSHFYESQLNDYSYTPGEEFKKAVKYLIDTHVPIPMWAMSVYTKSLPFNKQIDRYKLDNYQGKLLDRAIKVMKYLDMHVDKKLVYPCVSLPDEVLGLYRDGRMYISKTAFEKGFTCLLGTLYEEWLHHTTKCEDMTREMQNKLVDRIATLMDRIYTTDKGF
jgi:hypothetical protein